jgi:hypothetical protein
LYGRPLSWSDVKDVPERATPEVVERENREAARECGRADASMLVDCSEPPCIVFERLTTAQWRERDECEPPIVTFGETSAGSRLAGLDCGQDPVQVIARYTYWGGLADVVGKDVLEARVETRVESLMYDEGCDLAE